MRFTLLAAAAAVLVLAAPAEAALRFERCPGVLFRCARLSVPLDRTGTTPGRVSLLVKRIAARRKPRRGAVFVLAGGPGQSATASFAGDGLGQIASAFRRRDLIVFDQRGTGRSDVVRCPALERANLFDAGRAGATCARRLGPRRFHYTSRDSVEDIEAIRRRLGIAKIALYGTSYGVKVALGYALTYPDQVERLVLDSVVEAGGPDPFYRDTLSAVPRVLRSLCRAGCRSFTSDPVADLAALNARMGKRKLRGRLVDAAGRRRTVGLTRGELLLILISGDYDPVLRAAYPGAVRAALEGDPAQLLRLKRRSFEVDGEPPPARLFSVGIYTVTTCEEVGFPWARSAPPDPLERRRQARAAAAALPDSAFAPLDRGALLENDLLQLCDRWRAAPADPAFGPGPLPDVPTLILQGEDDLRTPVENARRVAAQLPRSRLVIAPATGHSALGSDLSGCAQRAFARFFSGRRVAPRCRRERRFFRPAPPPPRSLGDVEPLAGVGGLRGRTLNALRLTLRDVAEDSLTQFIFDVDDPDLARGGGLRAGRYGVNSENTLRLERLVFVPGVRVSGVVRDFGERSQAGVLRVSGATIPEGTLSLRGLRIEGRLGASSVRAVLRDGDRARAARVKAVAARLPGPAGAP